MADFAIRIAGEPIRVSLGNDTVEAARQAGIATTAADTASAAAIAALGGGALPAFTTLAAAHAAVTTGNDFILVTAGQSFQRRTRTASGSDVLFSFYSQPAGFVPFEYGGQTVSLPYYAPVTDLFILIGQSNSLGAGGSAAGSPSTAQYEVEHDGTIIPLDDTMQGAISQGIADGAGSMWPAFANEWLASTGRNSAFIQKAKSGTGLLAEAQPSGNWSSTGVLRGSALTAAQTAIDAISASPTLVLGNIYAVWTQGERDSQELEAGTAGVSAAAYEAELENLIDYYKTEIPTLAGFFIVRIGAVNDRSQAASWAAIRQAQENVAAASPIARVVSRISTSFINDALFGYMSDSLHWSQLGLNLNGKVAAREASKPIATPPPNAPVVLAKAAILDNDISNASSSTYSHTTDDDAQALIVVVGAGRYANSPGSTTTGVTFNGVALTQITDSPVTGQTGTTNTSAVGHGRVSIWRLTETDYGSPLGGETADLVVTQSGSANLISFAVYDIDCEPVQEATPFRSRGDGDEGTAYVCGYASSPEDGLTTGARCLVIAGIADVGDGAAALTHTWVGLDEDYDGGVSNGIRNAQFSSASKEFAAEITQELISCTTSGVSGGGLIVAAFRRKVDGE